MFVCSWNGQVVRQTWGSNKLDIIYDNQSRPYALVYNGTTYYYILNLQGDVIRIVDTSGNTVADYVYDAWGKPLNSTSYASSHLYHINPIRYRGYYYDTETGLYYLQSRYYDPLVKRFVNADGYASTGQGFIGCNMFAYCLNNLNQMIDLTGTKGKWIELGQGWYYRIDPANTSTNTKRHIHITNHKVEYIQNEDGSPHDKNRGEKGKLSNRVQKLLLQKCGWDYNGKREAFFSQTQYSNIDGMYDIYSYADGASVTQASSWLYSGSIDKYEEYYYMGNNDIPAINLQPTVIIPFPASLVYELPIHGYSGISSFAMAIG